MVILALRWSMEVVGLPPSPDIPTPRFPSPSLLLPQLLLPLLLLPKLAMPLLPMPKLRYPTLFRPTLPLLSATHLEAPDGTHSTAISQLQDGHQHTVDASKSMASAASLSTSRVALL